MNPSEAKSASVRPSYRPDRQVRSRKPHINFRIMPFSPPFGINAPFPCPEITAYGKSLVRFFRTGQAGGPIRKVAPRSPGGSVRSSGGSLPWNYRGWERVSGMDHSEAISTPVRPPYRPDRQVRSRKSHIGFGKMPFSPPFGVNAPSPCPEITTYGKPLFRFFRTGLAGDPVPKMAFRLQGGSLSVPTIKILEPYEEVSIHERNN